MHLTKCRFNDPKKHGTHAKLKMAIVICVVLCFLLAIAFLCYYLKSKPKTRASSCTPVIDRHLKVSYRDLFQATGGFSPTNLVGSGSYGQVYKGMINNELTVAVKVFNLQRKGAFKSFTDECESIRNIRHRNLVKTLTSCSSTDFEGNDFKSLVFEFMPNESLEKWLYGDCYGQKNQSNNLNLLQRLNIAIDVASALKYLHHECHVRIIHRDLKPSNVLLDNDMVAHVSDFGLAKLLSRSMDLNKNQSTSVGVMGSIGYAAPEYGMGGEASTYGDTYSYGILVLEMFIGRRPTDEMFKDGLNLHNYASKALPDQVIQIVDPMLLFEEDNTIGNRSQRHKLIECIAATIRIGVASSAESPTERMNMGDVIRELHTIRDSFLGTRLDS